MTTKLLKVLILLVIGASMTTAIQAQVLTPLASFDGTNGGNPQLMSLVQGFDGNLYGTTANGGTHAMGVVFKVSGGALSVLHNFVGNPTDGAFPNAGLCLSTSGLFFGTTAAAGMNNAGAIFEITPKGAYAVLHNFTGADGLFSYAPLVQVGPNFYGTTFAGGTVNGGTVFKITGAGAFSTLYNFTSAPDGASPRAPVLQGMDGNFYGTTEAGGSSTGGGAIFKMTPMGKEVVLQSFSGASEPYGGVVQGPDGSFYGTTLQGGTFNAGTLFKISKDGKTLTTLHNFGNGGSDGAFPYSTPILATDGNLYGVTSAGVGTVNEFGTIYRVAQDGSGYTILYDFTNLTDGFFPKGALFQATDGNFYGTTDRGVNGSANCFDGGTCGIVFSFSVGLGPFVRTLPMSGAPGASVVILGNNFTAASTISFNGTAAAVTFVSSTEIKTKVPAGATTGTVTVTTSGNTLSSNVPFKVL